MTNSISGYQPTVTTSTSSTTSASGASGSLGASSVSTTANATVTQTANATNSAATSSIQTTGETVVNYTNSASAPTVTVSTSSSSTQATATSNKTSQAVAGKITSPDTSESSETSSTSSSDHIPSDYDDVGSNNGDISSNYDDAAADYEPIRTTENIYESIGGSRTSGPENTSGGAAAALNSLRGSSYSNYDDAAADYEPIRTTENIYESIGGSRTSGPENTSGGAAAAALNSLRGSSYSNYDDAAADYEPIRTTENIYESIGGSRTSGPENTSDGAAAAALNSLRGSSYTTGPRNEGVFGPGPEGLPDMSLPSYDPTNKTSLLTFLSNPNVKSKMLENSGHFVFIDTDRSSFILVPNGNWDQVCSIKVQNGKTKEDLDIKDLENMCAKFCTGFSKFSGDWDSLVEPMVSAKAGVASGGNLPNTVIINNKFKTCVAYGPWNSQEASSGYTPSAWRRGHRVDFGGIFEKANDFNKINWGTQAGPSSEDDGISFSNETPGAGPAAAPSPTPSSIPIINVNVNVGGTNVNIGDTNVNTTNTTPTTQSKDASTDTSDIDDINTNNQTDDINTTDKDSDGAGGVNGDISETESSSGDDSGSVSSSESDKNASVGNDGPAMKDILSAVRKHLDVVYPGENGGSTEGPLPANQTLGDVISDVENKGSAQDTKLSGNTGAGDDDPTTTAAVGNGAEEITLSDTDSGIGDDVSDTASSSGDESGGVSSPSSESNKNTAVGNDGPSGLDILAAVRKHLDKVYPGDNGGSTEGPLQANQTLGDIVQDMETTGTSQETVVSPWKGSTSSTESAGGSGSVQTLLPSPPPTPSTTTLRTGTGATTTSLMMGGPIKADIITTGGGGRIPGGGTLEKLLPRIRAHLDISFDAQGDLVSTEEPQLGSIVNKFRQETGSRGILAFVESAPGKPGSAQVLTGTGGDKGNLFQAAAAVTQALGNVAGKVNLAIQGQKLSSLVNDDGKGSVGRDLFQAAAQTTQVLSALIDTVG
ncbi:translocated actin-recruiting phosphoprotein [Chlamydia trachomatis]|uniref:TarP n=2 Tax=Chlamydia trachomatis TaxID=813 RepID=E2IHS7_CHLTH|nr:type III secretion system actin-recruiting effector Tarp [Chlamydia trachomatis]ADK74117.1 TarP [Chlamydia trachomatis I/UW-12/UR]ADK74038.1 TarP [Chlamydia trachomatis]ADK74067.1 TarP [Chlamydia trachomatis]ADK74068.1 TarP [Chlamydia trachomatis]AFU23757.1 translocated actin-recruiting phosphoprotein [Chlamydia trachomatis]